MRVCRTRWGIFPHRLITFLEDGGSQDPEILLLGSEANRRLHIDCE